MAAWKQVAFVPSRASDGNATRDLAYSFDDHKVAGGTYYYRLIQEDVDGNLHPSQVVSAQITGMAPSIACYPNPSYDGGVVLSLWLPEESNSVTVYVSDALGRQVYESPFTFSGNGFRTRLDLSAYSAGEYQIRVVSKDDVYTQKLFLQNK